MIDLLTETTCSLTEAARLLPAGRRGRPVHLSCILRWITTGVPGPDGTLTKLDGARIGSRWITSKEAMQRFAEALTPRQTAEPIAPTRTLTRRQQANARAAKRLERAGI